MRFRPRHQLRSHSPNHGHNPNRNFQSRDPWNRLIRSQQLGRMRKMAQHKKVHKKEELNFQLCLPQSMAHVGEFLGYLRLKKPNFRRLTSQLNTMAYCGPACAVPSCASAPVVGFGSAGSKGLGCGLGYGGLGYGLGYGYGAGALAETSGSLGTLAGVIPSCINQIPPSEIVIQPPAVVVTIPGPILSASCDPVAVGGNTPCAPGGFGRFGGGYYGGRLGRYGYGSGALAGVTSSTINQIPSIKIVIQSPASIVTIFPLHQLEIKNPKQTQETWNNAAADLLKRAMKQYRGLKSHEFQREKEPRLEQFKGQEEHRERKAESPDLLQKAFQSKSSQSKTSRSSLIVPVTVKILFLRSTSPSVTTRDQNGVSTATLGIPSSEQPSAGGQGSSQDSRSRSSTRCVSSNGNRVTAGGEDGTRDGHNERRRLDHDLCRWDLVDGLWVDSSQGSQFSRTHASSEVTTCKATHASSRSTSRLHSKLWDGGTRWDDAGWRTESHCCNLQRRSRRSQVKPKEKEEKEEKTMNAHISIVYLISLLPVSRDKFS
ncbi:hypothetical protein Chor_005019 [Crotalus horridus]